MNKCAMAAAACLAAALLAGCASSGTSGPAVRSAGPPATTGASTENPALVAQPIVTASTSSGTGELGLLGSTFVYGSTAARATCSAGAGTVTATESWTSSGRGTHSIAIAGKHRTYTTSGTTGHDSATFTGLEPGTYYVLFSSTDGAAAREKVIVCG